jgi:hypothetical protein
MIFYNIFKAFSLLNDMESGKMAFLAIVFAVITATIFVSGCTSGTKNLTVLRMENQDYVFPENLYDSIKIPVNNESGIKELFDSYDAVCIIFDGSSGQDNAYFTVVLHNFVFKATRHYALNGKEMQFPACNEYNQSDIIVPMLVLKGPNTGATENSLTLNGTTITLQGTNSSGIQMAGDKLALVILGVDKLP